MTIYYNPKSPIVSCITDVKRWKFTCMYTVMVQRWEFWFFVLFHSALALLTSTKGLDTSSVGEPPASAAALVQFFMTFFITFYNKHCFSRYNRLYEECMQILDGAIFFVYEMTVSLGHTQLESHRVQATKYILATIYTFFMGLTGGELTPKEWHECERKGLLTKAETEALAEYPGHSYTLVLSTWAMQVIDDALENDCVWTKRSQRIAHLHNRLNNNIIGMLSACHAVGHIVACPIPFPYYHLMNLVLVLNFILVAFVLALLQSLFTIIPYMVVVLIFLGLREVATQLADPFGDDAVDFPVAEFLNYVTDQIICLLETFNRMDLGMLREAVEKERGFTSAQLLRQVDKNQLYKASGINFLDSSFNWHKAKALNKFDEDENPVTRLRGMFKNPPAKSAQEFLENRDDQGMTEDDVGYEIEKLHTRITSGEEELRVLQTQISELETARREAGLDRQVSADISIPVREGRPTDQPHGHHHHYSHHHHHDYEDHHHDDVSEGTTRHQSAQGRSPPQPPPRPQPQEQPMPQQQREMSSSFEKLEPVPEAPADFTSMASKIRDIKARASDGTAAKPKSSGDILTAKKRRQSAENGKASTEFGTFAEARAKLERLNRGGVPDYAEAPDHSAEFNGFSGAESNGHNGSFEASAVLFGRPASLPPNGTAVPSTSQLTLTDSTRESARGPASKTASRTSSREMASRTASRDSRQNGATTSTDEPFADARAEIKRALQATKTESGDDGSRRDRRRSPAASDTSSTRRRRSRS